MMNSVDSVVKRAPVKKTISGRKSRVRLPEWVTMNVGGTKFMTRREHFKAFPDALLGRELTLDSPHYNRVSQEFMFDRNPEVFACILDYYRTGELHFPHQHCGPSIKKELYYWGIDENEIAPCCWSRYKEYEEQEQTLQNLGKAFNVIDSFDKRPGTSHWVIETMYRWRERIWVFLEDPKSSLAAGLWAMLYMLLIFTSVLTLALETHSRFRIPVNSEIHFPTNDTMLGMTTVRPQEDPPKVIAMQNTKPHNALNVVDLIINTIFALDLLLRLIMSPNKMRFLKSWMNWLDIVVVASQWITTAMVQTRPQNPDPSWTAVYSIISIIRVARVFLIFKLARHYTGLRILLLALRASMTELLLLIVFVVIGMFIFSTLIFYAELYTKDQQHFGNIPVGFWWAIVTMTTVGYGDIHPMSEWGYLVGALCALTGMLATGLPIPIIANNFTLYYSVSKQKSRMDAREEQPGLLSIKSMKARMKKLADDFADVSQSAITKVFKKSKEDESTDEFDEEEEDEELEREEQERLSKEMEKEKEKEKERESTPDPYKKEGKVSEVRKKFEEAKQKQDGVVADASKNGSTDDLGSKTDEKKGKDKKDGKAEEQSKSKDSSDKKSSKDKESKDKESKSKDKESKDKESKDKESKSKDKESKDKESKDKDSKSKDKDPKDKESKSKDKDSKDKESTDKESKSKDKESKDKDSKSKDKEAKDESKDKVSKSKDKESKDKESKDKESKDKESKDKQSKDKESKDKPSKDSKTKDTKDADDKKKDSKEKKDASNDKPTVATEYDKKKKSDTDDKTKDSKEKKDTSSDKPTVATEYDKKKKADADDKTKETKEKKDTSNDKPTVATEFDKKKKISDDKKDTTPEKERNDKKETKDKGKSKEGKKEQESDQKEDKEPKSKESTPEPPKVTLATDRPYNHDS